MLFSMTIPVPVGMETLLEKLESAQNRGFEAIAVAVKDYFKLTKVSYENFNFTVHVSFSDEKFDSFRLLYCRFCNSKKFLQERFWGPFLPSYQMKSKSHI